MNVPTIAALSGSKGRAVRRATLLSLALILLFAGTFCWVLYRAVRQEQLNLALLAAIRDNSPQRLSGLLAQGADANVHDSAQSPSSWLEILQQFVSHRASAPIADTALMLAARQGNRLSLVEQLLRAGARVNAANGKGETALAVALNIEDADVMKTLLEHGADPNAKVQVEGKPVPVFIQMLNQFPTDGGKHHRTLARLMLDRDANVNTVDTEGTTALVAARNNYEPQIVQWLVDKGTDLTPAHNADWNVLCWAVQLGNTAIIKAALRRGLSVNTQDSSGRSPLMFAAAYGDMPILDLLLSHGADVNLRDEMGWTALMFAAQNQDIAIVQKLLDHGADRQTCDKEEGWTAEQRAAHRGQDRVAALIRTGHAPARGAERRSKSFTVDRWAGVSEPPAPVRIDGRYSLMAVPFPKVKVEEGEGDWGVALFDHNHRLGTPFRRHIFYYKPGIQVFRDVDGRPYAFIQGHHRSEPSYIVAVRNQGLTNKAECYGEYGVECQLLSSGGVLLFANERTHPGGERLKGLPEFHEYERVATVYRFRGGKLTRLGFIFLPQQ